MCRDCSNYDILFNILTLNFPIHKILTPDELIISLQSIHFHDNWYFYCVAIDINCWANDYVRSILQSVIENLSSNATSKRNFQKSNSREKFNQSQGVSLPCLKCSHVSLELENNINEH